MSAEERVHEFVRQWRLQQNRGGHNSDVIYGVHFDRQAEMAELDVNDLIELLAQRADPLELAQLWMAHERGEHAAGCPVLCLHPETGA